MQVPRVFLSHSSKNLDEVLRFDSQLRTIGVPLWRDRVDISKGAPIEQEIDAAGSAALGFAFYLTHDAIESPWVRDKELSHALRNARLDSSFGIVPVFRHDKDELATKLASFSPPGSAPFDFRTRQGHIMPSHLDDAGLERELATAAAVVLDSTLRTLRQHSAQGSRLRIAGITRNTTPWTTYPTDLVVDWSHQYPPGAQLPNPGIAETYLHGLSQLLLAVGRQWEGQRIQILPHCHPSMALALGFTFRRGTGYDLEVIDHATGSRVQGPARAVEPEDALWQTTLDGNPTARDIAAVFSISRGILADAKHSLEASGVDSSLIEFTPAQGASHVALNSSDPYYQHRLAVSAVARITATQRNRGTGNVHIFAAAPGTFTVLLGQQLTNMGLVQFHDFDTNCYRPTCRLQHR